jgi:lipoprotein-anchoring transpeptidase ErfK/SrfK
MTAVVRLFALAALAAAGLLSADMAAARGAGGKGVVPAAANASRIRFPAGRLPVLQLPDGQKRTVRSVLNTQAVMGFGDYLWDDDGVSAGAAGGTGGDATWVRVDLARQTLSVFRGGHEIGTAVILFGADNKPTPSGVFPVMAKAKEHRSSLYDAEMPFMLRLTGDGVAIHASDVRAGAVTHGCIGIPIGFAKRLYAAMRVGDEVAIIGR